MDAPIALPVACRLRLGNPVSATAQPQPCSRCEAFRGDAVTRDRFGHHALCCMAGGARCVLHNSLVDRIFADAAFGLLHPVGEAHPFADGDRLDIVFRTGTCETLVDVAVTCPFRPSSIAAAGATPSGAATAYEAVKRARYGAKCRAGQELVPLVFDTFGGAGLSGRPVLSRIASAFARRFGSRTARVLFFTRLVTLVVSKCAGVVAGQG